MRPNNGSKKVCVRVTFISIDPLTKKGKIFVRFVRVWAGSEQVAFEDVRENIAIICKVEHATEQSRLVVCNEFEPK